MVSQREVDMSRIANLLELRKKYAKFLKGELNKYDLAKDIYAYCAINGKTYEEVALHL